LQRCGKSCRLRWTNYLRPDIKRGRFSFEEEETIIQLHSVLGNKWSAIAARLPGRTDNEIKNYWNTHVRKRLLRMGIDPVTHSPRLDLLDFSSILNSSLYNPSQMNLSRLLGLQPFVNPEILSLATSLFSSHCETPSFLLQNAQETQLTNPNDVQIQPNQLHTLIQEVPICTTMCAPGVCVPFAKEKDHIMEPNVELNEWESNGNYGLLSSGFTEEDNTGRSYSNYGYYGNDSGQTIIDPPAPLPSEYQNFNFASVLSTPSSSPAPMNSNSTYVNSNGTATEDERESYCSSRMLSYEMPDMFDVNYEFM
ncbi:hypothetical protein U1Q18_009057, partial [Sarracenia purpurea var. burkii]